MFEYKSRNDIKIEVYRNFEITFNTETETFNSVSDYFDTEIKGKKSYAIVKKAIDNWIKENETFKPFFVHDCYRKDFSNKFPISSDDGKLKVTGIRRDKRFTCGDNQIPEYNEKDIFLALPENEPIFEEFKPLLDERVRLETLTKENNDKIIKVGSKLKLVPLNEFKKTL